MADAPNQRSNNSANIDVELVRRVQQGDKGAFDLLVRKYQQRVGKLVSRFIADRSEVEDVTQEAFIKAYRALPNFRGDSAFYTWLYRIATNTAKNYLVAAGRRPPRSDVDITTGATEQGFELEGDQSPEGEMASEEIHRVIRQALEQMPEELRLALTMCEFDGFSYDEIAEVMECPIGTVRSRIFRARQSLDKKLRPLISTNEVEEAV
ncbi:MAG: RNA polymerase sigma factor RpoE [Immundisolibacteraceae bacterium]|nr:RNA polymerase sigma factor RpoE [Immundisolibacteraceae bacterium]